MACPSGFEPLTYSLEGCCYYPAELRAVDILFIKLRLLNYPLNYRQLFGALCRIRTDHLRITKPLLYQMS